MTQVPWQWWAGGVVASAALLWIFARNLNAVRSARAMLDGRPARRLARVAWLTSLFATWTGPMIGAMALISVVLGLISRKEPATPRTRLEAAMAIENGLILAVATSALVLLLWWGSPPR